MGSTKSDLTQLVRVYWSLLLGNIIEWYDYAVYGYLAVHLEHNFFGGSAISVWLGFGVTFLARPLGGLLMGVIGDRFGRSVAVNISIIGMLIGTCGQGCLPTFESNGQALGMVGLVLLVILRFVQGLSTAGEISTITTYLTEVSSHNCLCRGTSLIGLTANAGFLLAKATTWVVGAVFGDEATGRWAWRLPFLFASVPGIIAIWGRRGIPESGMFLESKEGFAEAEQGSSVAKIRQSFALYWRNILIGMGCVGSFAILQYGCFVWGQSFLVVSKMVANDRMIVDLINRCMQMFFAFLVGWFGDKFGVGSVMACAYAGVVVTGLPLWFYVENNPTDLFTVALALGVGYGFLGALGGTLPFYFCAELFPTEVRNTAMGISYNVGFALFGGLAPVIAEAVYEASPLGPGLLYTSGGVVSTLTLACGLAMQRRGLLTLAHVRATPYIALCGGEVLSAKGTTSTTASFESEESMETHTDLEQTAETTVAAA